MATVPVPWDWPSEMPAMRSGLPPRASLGYTLDQQGRFLGAGWRLQHTIWTLGDDTTTGLNDGNTSDSDPEVFLVEVPPWTKYIAWAVLTQGTGRIRVQADGEPYQHEVNVTYNPHGHDAVTGVWTAPVIAYPSDQDNQQRSIEVPGGLSPAWQSVEIALWVVDDDVEVFGVYFEPLRLTNVDGQQMDSTL